jgi:hypothetical protein
MPVREALIKFGSLKGTAFRPSVNAQYEAGALAPEGCPTDLIRPSLASPLAFTFFRDPFKISLVKAILRDYPLCY